MYRHALKIAAFLAGFLTVTLSLTACGGDDDGPASTPGRLSGPTKISYSGMTFFKFSYDSEGRMTSMTTEDLKLTITYSPMTIRMVDDEGETLFEDIELNSKGYLTKANITDISNGTVERYWGKCTYDEAGHWIGQENEGEEPFVFSWSSNGISINDGDEYYTIKLSDVKNTAGVFSPNWGVLGLFGITGLFGKAPEYFPTTINFYNDIEDDGYSVTFKYLLLTDGRIGKESVTEYGETMTLTYSYPTRSADDSFIGDDATVSTKKFKNIFKRKRK